ncbi:MAG: hypothetical protein RID90_14905 [Marinovum algicola]
MNERLKNFISHAESRLEGICDLYVIGYFPDENEVPKEFMHSSKYFPYREKDIVNDLYPVKGRSKPFEPRPGNFDLVILKFAQDNPLYDYYWHFEYDVDFSGEIDYLVKYFSKSESDLLATNIRLMRKNWENKKSIKIPSCWSQYQQEDTICFLPAFRVSFQLLKEIDRFYKIGGSGHHEWAWPFVAINTGLLIEDIGGNGNFVKKENINRFYTSSPSIPGLYPGTFRFEPPMQKSGRRPLTLWHPVKDHKIKLKTYLKTWYRIFKFIVKRLK